MSVRISIADVRIGWTKEELKSGKGPPLVRLQNPSPKFYRIGPRDSLAGLFDRILTELDGGMIEMLSIYAHGYVEEDARHRMHGGYGIVIGLEDILPGNAAALFGRFKGDFAKPVLGIELVGCKVAVRSAVKIGATVAVGDGVALCRAIATAAGTCVRASSEAQKFDAVAEFTTIVADKTSPLGRSMQSGTVVDPGPWEGNTWIICEKGSHKG